MIAASIIQNDELIAAAILHDTIEYTSSTEDELIQMFIKRVAKLVMSNTKNI